MTEECANKTILTRLFSSIKEIPQTKSNEISDESSYRDQLSNTRLGTAEIRLPV